MSPGHRSSDAGRRAPPWWPQGEHWPPHGPPWRLAPRRFRRRFLGAALGVLVVLVGTGFVLGSIAGRGGGDHRPEPGRREVGPWGLFALAGFVAVVGGGATVLAYRRISGPVGALLAAAGELTDGRYDVRVEPGGPRELRSLVATFNDMAARLDRTEQQRRRFLADVTHELRTPLAVLQSGVEAQLDGIHPRDDRRLTSLLEETQLLGRLIDDLHTLALADAGRLTLHRERTLAAALVGDAVESHAALAERRGIVLTESIPAGLPELDVDPARVRQVLSNLLSNAVRHSGPGGRVHAGAAIEGDGVRVTVTDSGPGIPPDQLEHVFDRFTRSADSRGSGLGLSIARDLVHAHGGTIEVANGPTGGAVFSFTMPAAPGPAG